MSTAKIPALLLENVYPLADALQIDLMVNDRSGRVRILGEQEVECDTGGVTFSMKPRVCASGVHKDEAWVLVRIIGDLCLLLTYLKKDDLLYAWVVDGMKGNIPINDGDTAGRYNGLTSLEVVDKLKYGRVAIFRRDANKKWSVLDVGGLDERLGAVAKEKRRQSHSKSRNPA